MPPRPLCWPLWSFSFSIDKMPKLTGQPQELLRHTEGKRLVEKRKVRGQWWTTGLKHTQTKRQKSCSFSHTKQASRINTQACSHIICQSSWLETWRLTQMYPVCFSQTHIHNQELQILDHSHTLGLYWPSCWLLINQPQLCASPSSPPSSATFPLAHPLPLPHPEHSCS